MGGNMITEAYIMKLVDEYAKSPAGKAEIKKKYGIDYTGKQGTPGGFTGKVKSSELIKYGEIMKKVLFIYIQPIIKSITLDDIKVEDPYKNANGQWVVNVSFKEGSLRRDSLDTEDYPYGIENIVLLFAKGYHANNYAYGLWNVAPPGRAYNFKSVRSRTDREGNDFLIKAVEDFNTNFGKGIAKAELLGDYKECSENPN